MSTVDVAINTRWTDSFIRGHPELPKYENFVNRTQKLILVHGVRNIFYTKINYCRKIKLYKDSLYMLVKIYSVGDYSMPIYIYIYIYIQTHNTTTLFVGL